MEKRSGNADSVDDVPRRALRLRGNEPQRVFRRAKDTLVTAAAYRDYLTDSAAKVNTAEKRAANKLKNLCDAAVVTTTNAAKGIKVLQCNASLPAAYARRGRASACGSNARIDVASTSQCWFDVSLFLLFSNIS